MKKILFITNIPAPYRVDFYNELGKYIDLTVIFESKGASDQGIKFNYNFETIKNFKAIFLSEGNIRENKIDWSIFKHLKIESYDEIVVTNYSYRTEMAALLYLKFRRVGYYMETDGGMVRQENALKRKYKTFLISDAKGYFSPSKSSDDYLAFYGAKRERIYRYPFTSLKEEDILPEVLSNDEKAVYKQKIGSQNAKMILGVGQFIHRKGWDILLQAAAQLKDLDIYIVGGKATDEYLKMKEELGLFNVHFDGFKTKEELEVYFKAADVFVLPTREDIWGLVVNEAMAYGLPVVTTDRCVSGIELVQDDINGYIVESENVQQLAEAMKKTVDENINGKLSKKALEMAGKYTIENMARAHKNIFF